MNQGILITTKKHGEGKVLIGTQKANDIFDYLKKVAPADMLVEYEIEG